MTKPKLEDQNFESMALKNQLDLLVHQAHHSHPERQKHYEVQISQLASRYYEVTGQHYTHTETARSSD